MAIRKIITTLEDEEFLRKKSKPVTEFDESLHTLLDDMWDTVRKHRGAGLSAVQVGVLKRAFIVDINGEYEFINPEVTGRSEAKKLLVEGCLSVVDNKGASIFSKVYRNVWVRVKAQDRNGNWFEKKFKGYQAQCVQHECDHMDGIIYTDLEGEEL